ncbi:hypothetical protein C8T65DRAFT_748291 [Cerioporus squamosus]|nr:hypothetical protein C8T65DRAFT_748291 [Cerioporus squamosus]
MHIRHGKHVEHAATPAAAPSTSMPGDFDTASEGNNSRLRAEIVCYECHLLSLGRRCVHCTATSSDDEVYSEARSVDDGDNGQGSVGSLQGMTHQEEVAHRSLSPASEHSSALWVGVSPGSSFLADNTSGMRTPTPPPDTQLPSLATPVAHAHAAIQTVPAVQPVAHAQAIRTTPLQPAAAQAIPTMQPAAHAQPIVQPVAHAQPVVPAQPVVQPVVQLAAHAQPAAAAQAAPAIQPAAHAPVVPAVQPVAHAQAVAVTPLLPAGQAQVPPNQRAQADARLAQNNVVAHYDPNDPMFTGKWYVVTRGRTVSVFRHQGPANTSVNGFRGQNRFHAKPYEAACKEFYSCVFVDGDSEDVVVDLGLRQPPYAFAMPDAPAIAALEKSATDGLELALNSIHCYWIQEEGRACFQAWSTRGPEKDFAVAANAELGERLCAWNTVAADGDSADEEDLWRKLYLDWGSKWIVWLWEELKVRRRGLEVYLATRVNSELPTQRLYHANMDYLASLSQANSSNEEACNSDDLFSEMYD